MSVVLDVADLAAGQWGLVTTAQARGLGVSAQSVARLAAQGALERITHGVYRVTGAPASPLDGLRAAWLTLDPERPVGDRLRDQELGVVSHRSAAAVHGLGDLEADEFEFTSTTRKQSRRSGIRLHRGYVGVDQWSVADGLPVTTVIRTIDDLAAARTDGGHLASIVRDALTRHQIDPHTLTAALRPHAHHYGAPTGDGEALLRRLLQESGISEALEAAVRLATPTRLPGDTRHPPEIEIAAPAAARSPQPEDHLRWQQASAPTTTPPPTRFVETAPAGSTRPGTPHTHVVTVPGLSELFEVVFYPPARPGRRQG